MKLIFIALYEKMNQGIESSMARQERQHAIGYTVFH